jgi:predicted transposase YdaD
MEESVTYQEIIEKGKAEGKAEGLAEEAQRFLLLLGTDAFGAPDDRTKAAIAGLADPARLEALIQRVGKVKGWRELLAKRTSQRRNGSKG